ncbi:unnamed protein product [Zymoseptoria tritici ST99CH_1E4]|uniref:Nudix hydrolase domain-containing protein n=2 Tax=Zymoseptoria tritici TaxID=1047171 RepID=A0A2H1H050_ZYMTR|nr:unnamed protein product [Zymoseptoria tritici ST99CH_1E4]
MTDTETTIAQMTLVDWLDDLTVRFLLNLPPAELSSVPRLCFQVEEAQWFYEDFIRPANPSLPSLNLRQFCLTLFQHCPLLSGFNAAQHLAAYEEFLAYKVRVPVRGAILMDDKMEKVLLVRGWKKGASWSFPRGKINKNEPDIDCAIREVYEETGYDAAAAGLVEKNLQSDGEVKSIDVTMREQHMKLFVFRGVPLETYFEPRTRKEIGKISWYNIKDLPGFKKQKGLAGQGTGEAQAAKFYMVAPFLGHLKRFINQQRKPSGPTPQHVGSVPVINDGLQTTVTEDEGDTEAEPYLENGLGIHQGSAEALKRLLAIKSPMMTPAHQVAPEVSSSNLLAMLRGGQSASQTHSVHLSFDPRTPFEQIDNPIPTQPPALRQPQHPQRSEVHHQHQGYQQVQHQPQEFLAQQHRNASMPMPGTFGPQGQEAFGQALHPRLSEMKQQTSQQQRQHSLPVSMHNQGPRPIPHQQSHQANLLQAFQGRPQASVQPQVLPGPNAPLASPMPVPHQWKNGTVERPVSQGLMSAQTSIGSGPSAPEASKLPPPNLNAHSMNLLNAFKNSNNNSAVSSQAALAPGGRTPGNEQQTALLDLFRKPSASQAAKPPQPAEQASTAIPTSPTGTDTTITASSRPSTKRKPTFNEITRTLPLNLAPRQPVPSKADFPPLQPQQPIGSPKQPAQILTARPRKQDKPASPPKPDSNARPKAEGRPQNPASPQIRASPQGKKSQPKAAGSPREQPYHVAQSPRAASRPKSKTRQPETSQPPVPQFSILQRPGSSAGMAPRSPAVQSPLRFDGTKPVASLQVLKRPTSSEASAAAPLTEDAGKKEQLLSLLRKPSAVPASSQSTTAHAPPPQTTQEKNNTLLGLLTGRSSTPVIAVKTPEPPAAPQLQPERNASYQGQPARSNTAKQSNLLNLFTSGSKSTSMGSPGTPISPFTLGTPATKGRQQVPFGIDLLPEPRSRVGSMASAVSNGSASGQQTPTEAKDFLLGYLNGVVQKEGYRGTKKV